MYLLKMLFLWVSNIFKEYLEPWFLLVFLSWADFLRLKCPSIAESPDTLWNYLMVPTGCGVLAKPNSRLVCWSGLAGNMHSTSSARVLDVGNAHECLRAGEWSVLHSAAPVSTFTSLSWFTCNEVEGGSWDNYALRRGCEKQLEKYCKESEWTNSSEKPFDWVSGEPQTNFYKFTVT